MAASEAAEPPAAASTSSSLLPSRAKAFGCNGTLSPPMAEDVMASVEKPSRNVNASGGPMLFLCRRFIDLRRLNVFCRGAALASPLLPPGDGRRLSALADL